MKKIRNILLCLILLSAALQISVCAEDPETNPAGTFDPGTETVLLNSGYEIPLRGVCCTGASAEETENLVYLALKSGIRFIDVSDSYKNEEAAGRGIQKAIDEKIVSRDEIFVAAGAHTEKYETGEAVVEGSLTRLGLDHLDLMFLQQNDFAKDRDAWLAMNEAAAAGTVRSLGLSGFYEVMNYELITGIGTVQPAVIRVGISPYQQDPQIKAYAAGSGTVVMTQAPFGDKVESRVLFADPVISRLATWYRKTSDQIVLRWQLQNGTAAVPCVKNEAQLNEYADILDFSLSDEEMQQINALNRRDQLYEFISEAVNPEY